MVDVIKKSRELVTCLTQFADELLEHICCSPTLDYKDIINLSLTCRRFFTVTQSNEVWRQKLMCRWQKWEQPFEGNNIQKVFKDRIILERYLVKKLASLASTAYDYDDVPYKLLGEFNEIYASDEDKLPIMLEILFMFSCERDDTGGDINRKYYARKVFQYVYHEKLKKHWTELLNSTDDDAADVERGAILISQWFNHESRISSDEISQQIDSIATLVKAKVPGGNCSSVSSYCEAVAVVKAINEVIYNDLGFNGNSGSYYNLKNSFIHKVLERKSGIPITLAVLYIAVARRVGLHMQGVNFPGHFLLRIMVEKIGGVPVYVDAFNKGALLDDDQCMIQFVSNVDQFHWPKEVLFQVADKRKIFIRMVTNIINILKESTVMDSRNLPSLRTAHELMFLLDPDDEENNLLLSKIYLHQGINLEEVAATLRGMFSSSRNTPSVLLDSFLVNTAESRKQEKMITPKYRSYPENREVKYRVGMLMKHKRYNYMCVIYGWDPICRMDDVWQAQMGVHRLNDKERQPFYHVLAHDGSSRYAAQENMLPADTTSPILHPEVGKYFKSFNGVCYVFTDKLAETYPEDQLIPEVDVVDVPVVGVPAVIDAP